MIFRTKEIRDGTERQALLETLTRAHQVSQAMLEELDELRSTLRPK